MLSLLPNISAPKYINIHISCEMPSIILTALQLYWAAGGSLQLK